MKRDFKKKKIGEICNVIGGGTPSKSNADFFNGTIPWATVRDMKDDVLSDTEFKITEEALRQSASNVIPRNNVVIASRVGLGKVCLLEKDTAINQDLRAIIPKNKDELHVPFLFWWFKKSSDLIIRNGRGATVKGVNLPFIKNLEIELPAIEEQKRIVSLLDQADALRRKRKESMELLDQYVQSVFMEMFGDPVVNPHGFSITELQTCYKGKDATRCGPFGSALKKQDYCEKGIPVWTMENIKGMTFDPTGYLHVSENKYAELIQYKTQNGDIIISRAGTVGKMAIIETSDDRSIISTNLIKLSLDEKKLLPLYFVSLMFFCSKRLARLKTGKEGTFTHMNTGVLNSIKFPLPPIDLQKKFASLFTEINSIKKTMQAQLFEFDNQFNSLMQKAFA